MNVFINVPQEYADWAAEEGITERDMFVILCSIGASAYKALRKYSSIGEAYVTREEINKEMRKMRKERSKREN